MAITNCSVSVSFYINVHCQTFKHCDLLFPVKMFKCKYKNIIKRQRLRLINVIAFLPLSKLKYNSKKLYCVYIIKLSSYPMGAATDGISVSVIFL